MLLVKEDDPERPWTAPGVFRTAPGVHRVPLPMPNDHLRGVNVFVLEDGDSLALIDSGVSNPVSRDRLLAALDALGHGPTDISRFLVTHVHYDHYSQALAIREEASAPVALGVNEAPSVAVLSDSGVHPLGERLALLRKHGSMQLADDILEARGDRGSRSAGYPDVWLANGEEVDLASRTLESVHTPGHTRGHVVFVDSVNRLTFAGDHVLPHITPSIGFEAAPTPLPLGDYLDSLARVRQAPDTRMLPAHGPVQESIHVRIDELLAHHEKRLAATEDCLTAQATSATDVAQKLGWTRRLKAFRELDPFNRMLAVLETAAHLNLLVARGGATRTETAATIHYTC